MNFGQATFNGTEIKIECGEKMTCCQREQTKAKVEEYQGEINAPDLPGPLQIAPSVTQITQAKDNAQSRARNRMKKQMDGKTRDEKKQIAKDHGATDCFAEQIADGEKFEMDHPTDSKLGGAANVDRLIPLDPTVNGFFGSIAKRTGDDMLAAGSEEISNVVLECTPPCNPPKQGDQNKDYSTGTPTAAPSGSPNQVRTYLPG